MRHHRRRLALPTNAAVGARRDLIPAGYSLFLRTPVSMWMEASAKRCTHHPVPVPLPLDLAPFFPRGLARPSAPAVVDPLPLSRPAIPVPVVKAVAPVEVVLVTIAQREGHESVFEWVARLEWGA